MGIGPSQDILIVGGSGNIGSKIITHLSRMIGEDITIKIGTRDITSEKIAPLLELEGVEVVECSFDNPPSIVEASEGCNCVFFNPPSHPLRGLWIAEATRSLLKYNEEVSIFGYTGSYLGPNMNQNEESKTDYNVANEDTIFSKHWYQAYQSFLEASRQGKKTISFELPFFMENINSFSSTIKNENKINSGNNPNAKLPWISCDDAGRYIAIILSHPDIYLTSSKKVPYRFFPCGDFLSFNEISELLSNSLNKQIDYIQISYDQTKNSLLSMGWNEEIVNGLIEFYQLCDLANEKDIPNQRDTYASVSGLTPTDFAQWISSNRGNFL